MESYLLNSESICSNIRQANKAFAQEEKGQTCFMTMQKTTVPLMY